MAGSRLPDFLLIGVMKAGTTTLFRWLDDHPGVRMPADKEPAFFSDDRAWRRGVDTYGQVFDGIPADLRTGEASVSYSDPRTAAVVVPRIAATLPDARFVCLLRDPVTRLRSHYRHEVLRGREAAALTRAVTVVGNAYVARSSYGAVLEPWWPEPTGRRLHVVLAEDLFAPEQDVANAAWSLLLRHLDLAPVPRPTARYNTTEGKVAFSPLLRRLYDAGIVQRIPRPPVPVRAVARRMLLRDPSSVEPLLASAAEELPPAVTEHLAAETDRAARLLGRSLPYDVA